MASYCLRNALGTRMWEVYLERSWIFLTICFVLMLPLIIFTSPLLKLLRQTSDLAVLTGLLTILLGLWGYLVFHWCPQICSKRVTVPILITASSADEVADDPCPPRTNYEVFISFRGEDTRHNFTSHLYNTLCKKKIKTFIDNTLNRGEQISSTLLKTIEESEISVIIFSKDYASSTWCLEELVKILECKERYGRLVIPVFYNVNPSNVRRQTGSYADSFVKHEKRFKNNIEKVHKWKVALTEASNLFGLDSTKIRLESELVEKIVEDVLQKLKHMNPHIPKGLVGIAQISRVESLLCIGSADVRIIGIWGMGGIGKTTIAEALFTRFSSEYDGCSFASNVREEWKNQRENDLRDKLLADILGENNLHISTPSISSNFVRESLQRRKLLVVLDDVSGSKQIEYLIGNKDLFGLGSRIIVTTRNKDVLNMGSDRIYEVMGLNFDDALRLFSLNAFEQDHPKMIYRHLSERVINYAKGIPLALKVLGSSLRSKTPKEWESTLEKLIKLPNPEIYDVLRLSYEGLDREVQNIFLDIACFLKGEKKCFITTLLDGCDYSSDIGMRILEDNSLITVSKFHEVQMHDLIQEMGWEIVRQESPKKLGKRSRLWDPKEIYYVLEYNMGTDAVEGIVLDMSQIKDVKIRPQAFARMCKLRILKFYMPSHDKTCNVHISRGLESLPDELSYLRWDCFPSKTLPQSFCAEKLVQLDLKHSLVERLWDGVQDLANLKSLYLSVCKNLVELPDFSKASKLEEVHLDYCTSLRNLPSSILSSEYLCALNLRCCRELQYIPSEMHSKSLRWLIFSGCSKLVKFSVASEKLEYLNLEGTAIEELSSSVGRLKNLSSLNLSWCRRLKNLPKNFYKIGLNTSIQFLNCPKLEILPPIFDASGSVKSLCLDGCSNLSKLPDNLGLLSALNRLSLRGSNIETLPVSIKHLSQLRSLNVSDCKRLQSLPELPLLLQDLNASGCISLETVSSSGVALLQNLFGRSNKRSFLKQIQEDEAKFVRHRDYLGRFEFYNCRKLDQNAHKSIMAETLIRIQHAEYLSSMIKARYDPYYGPNQVSIDYQLKNFEYTSRRVYTCLPGSEVPKWFWYKATKSSTITLTVRPYWFSKYTYLGFVFCLVHARSESNKMGNNNDGFDVGCAWYLDREYKGTSIMKSSHSDAQSDQVSLWYNKLSIRADSYSRKVPRKVSFEFFARGYNSRLIVKQCGVLPLYAPDDIYIGQSSNGQEGNKEGEKLYFESKLKDLGFRMSSTNLNWDGYPWKSLPLDFCALEYIVVILSLRDSKIESLPASIKHLSRLKYLLLNNCVRLQSIPELPQSIECLHAYNCRSLETVNCSTSELIQKDYRKEKRIIVYIFENCMKLDEHTIDALLTLAHLRMKQAACDYMLSITNETEAHPDFRHVDFRIPGSEVPDWFTYRTTQASMNIEVASPSDLLGFAFCVVISDVPQVEEYPTVGCRCYGENGEIELIIDTLGAFLSGVTNSDHAYLWWGTFLPDIILRTDSLKVSFVFEIEWPIRSRESADIRRDCFIIVKEYGVCPLYASECYKVCK